MSRHHGLDQVVRQEEVQHVGQVFLDSDEAGIIVGGMVRSAR